MRCVLECPSVEVFDKFELFKNEHHFGVIAAVALEEGFVVFTPTDEGFVFAFFECLFFGDTAEADFVDGSCADHQRWRGVPVGGDVAAADDGHGLGFVREVPSRRAGGCLFAFADEFDQFSAELFVVTELEGACAGVSVVEVFGVGHFVGLSVSKKAAPGPRGGPQGNTNFAQ